MKLILLFLILFTSCNTAKQDQRNVDKAAVRHPEILAKKARDLYPCVTTNGDTIFITDSAAYHDALTEMADSNFHLYHRNDSLQALIDSTKKDSSCFNLVSLYTQVINNQKEDYKKLQEKFKHIPPVVVTKTIIDTVLDQAALKACEFDKSTTIQLLSKKTAESDKWQGKAKNRFWVIIIMGAIIGVGAYIKIRSLFIPKLKSV